MTLIALGAASTSDEAYQLPLDQVVNLNDIFNDANVKIVTSGSTPTTVIGKDVSDLFNLKCGHRNSNQMCICFDRLHIFTKHSSRGIRQDNTPPEQHVDDA